MDQAACRQYVSKTVLAGVHKVGGQEGKDKQARKMAELIVPDSGPQAMPCPRHKRIEVVLLTEHQRQQAVAAKHRFVSKIEKKKRESKGIGEGMDKREGRREI